MNKKVKHGTLLTVIFTLLSLLYLYPIILVFINSFKKKVRINALLANRKKMIEKIQAEVSLQARGQG